MLPEFHKKFHILLGQHVANWDDHYLPGKLIFHCSLNIGLNKVELMQAATVALDTRLPILGRVESIGLLKSPIRDFKRTFVLSGKKPS